jgi:hypothetical protein
VPKRMEVDGLTCEQVVYLRKLRDSMIWRCHNPNSVNYHIYGGRGIRVCDEWRASSLAFLRWAASSGYVTGLQIDRINNDGNYEPSNCRWATRSQNCQNRRKASASKFKGVRRIAGSLQRPWQARVLKKHVGVYATEEEAARAYDAKALELFGEFACLNFPVEQPKC